MKRLLLFVACINEDFDGGLTYAADLARLLDKDMAMLVIDCNRTAIERFEKIMMSVTLAEANEHDKALEIIRGDGGVDLEDKIRWFIDKCSEIGIDFSIHHSEHNILDAIFEFLNGEKGVDMVLLGPSVTDNGNITPSELNKLVRTASKPVVTMSRQATQA